VFVVGLPLAGGPLLAEALSLSRSAWTVGADGGLVLERVPALTAAAHAFSSDRLAASDLDAGVEAALRHAYAGALRDRAGRCWSGDGDPQLVDEGLCHALRVDFLARVFPQARFLVLVREALATVAAMLDTWRAGTGVTHERLPGWGGGRWSLPLVPGWRGLEGQALPVVAARQYLAIQELLQADLAALDPERLLLVRFEELLEQPRHLLAGVARFAGLDPEGMEDWVPPEPAMAAALPEEATAALAPQAEALRAADAALRGLLAGREPDRDGPPLRVLDPGPGPALDAGVPTMPYAAAPAYAAAAADGAAADGADFSRDP